MSHNPKEALILRKLGSKFLANLPAGDGGHALDAIDITKSERDFSDSTSQKASSWTYSLGWVSWSVLEKAYFTGFYSKEYQ